ncbi:carbohydrate ABC transporter permease [Streptomyces shenzhenensis]|uniref:carbohydrate ABC transporter permease n=1 Tax=Streptomyces shenzhenensis TaxID=943815 RepID=UPI0036B0555B
MSRAILPRSPVAAEPSPRSHSVRRRRLGRRDAGLGLLFLLPLFAGLLVFRFYAFGYNVWLSFTKAGAFGPPRWIGLDNFREMFTDELLGVALVNTFKYCAFIVPGVVVVSLLCATLMTYRFPGQSVFRAVIFLPAVALPTAMVFLFGWIFQTQYGIANAAIKAAGGSPVSWFGSATGVTVVVTVVVVFLSFSVPTIVLYAGMQDIPPDAHRRLLPARTAGLGLRRGHPDRRSSRRRRPWARRRCTFLPAAHRRRQEPRGHPRTAPGVTTASATVDPLPLTHHKGP